MRFCDDFVVGFQHREDATRFHAELQDCFGKSHLELHAEKTRLIEFGRFEAQNRRSRGEGKPETFDFLGFTHSCGRTRKGKFTVIRQTMRKRMRAKLKELQAELRRRLHDPVPEVGSWLQTVVLGHQRYYGAPGNGRKMQAFKYHLSQLW